MNDFIKKVTSSKTRRDFTFQMNSGIKYRTVKMTQKEFEQESETDIDQWQSFLETDKLNYYELSKPKN